MTQFLPRSSMSLATLLALTGVGSASARSLWSSQPVATDANIIKTTYPLGNGRLGAMPIGAPQSENVVLNLDSLWSGGPFQNSSYTGGNPPADRPKYPLLADIRSTVFKDGTGTIDPMYGSPDNYGTYQVLGSMVFDWDGFTSYSNYKRSLDLQTGVHTTSFVSDSSQITTTMFCSYPDQVCVWSTTSNSTLPKVTISLRNTQVSSDLITVGCEDDVRVRLTGVTQKGDPEGMRYQAVVQTGQGDQGPFARSCTSDGKLVVQPAEGTTMVTVVIAAGSNFDQTKGNADNNYSFKGEDPGTSVTNTANSASSKNLKSLLQIHINDFSAITGKFSLNLSDTKGSEGKETADIIADLTTSGDNDPFLDGLLFDYSRYLLISSSRDNSLPANLQGRWAELTNPSWGADYHANINLQMNYWPADQTGLRETQKALWDYMRLNWVPRGTETARLLYNASGWVTHNEMNIFGHTAMKNWPGSADYPAAPAWMMQHVWNYYDYTMDLDWLITIGYPLIKGVAEFWLSQLQRDDFSKDGTLVVNPCGSPEQGPTTFGCANYQQEIHHVLNNALISAKLTGDLDAGFVSDVQSKLSALDKGFHLTTWGGVKEWKLPDSYGYETQGNHHRHLSHLTGWFPGWSVSGYLGGYANSTIQSAVNATLVSRGNGYDDANAGWEKVWRSACWARLNNTDQAYYELKFTIEQNMAPNGLSMYSGKNTPFQIDANFGFGGAMLSMLAVDLPLTLDADILASRNVVLGPAIPAAWANGNAKGLRIRGGGTVDFEWDSQGLVTKATLSNSKTKVTLLNKAGTVLAQSWV